MVCRVVTGPPFAANRHRPSWRHDSADQVGDATGPQIPRSSKLLGMSSDAVGAKKKLVIGASGFLGSHVTRQLVAAGDDVRVMLRRTSSTKGIDDLDVERYYGDVFDDDALRLAMTD